ncbi:TRAPP II complex [Lobosporangium transversale]|uniref:TRAPP II complex n=1 Tax=Lobosporangium transversale TaxID=64571 RepID=A0A1Y2GAD9_9FUNG|nr:TRAPP II complex [Lobosporangium transversale]ORZ04550.1 TRAPP II complex [Lobosporangium transversale]|eukprot:XP_021876596.1 TRAPP II complex [Lobosporangium transversale]
MDVVNFTSAARIRVLLVPVGPIKKATFENRVKMLRQHNSVKLEEVWMGPRTENSFFSQNVPHEGQLYFNFTTSYSAEHQYLEEFQMHRRVFGVIGIMDCQEWPDGNMAAGHQRFQQILSKYPSAIANQCFAFDPSEQHPDDLRGGGVIMIPNVGNTSSYLRVLICDLARTILTEFENIASAIGKRQDIESPNPAVSVYARHGPMPLTASVTSMPDMSTLTAPPSAMTTSGSSTHSRALSSAGFTSIASGNQYVQSAVMTDQRLRKRTAARAQKLYGDLYLMAGRISDAVSSYQSVIEATKSNSDFLWQANAMEGLYCAVVLLAFVQADLAQFHQQQVAQTIISPTSPTSNEHAKIQNTPVIKPLIVDIPEKYQAILTLYNKVPGNATPPILCVEASMKVTKFIATCFVCGNGILDDRALAAVVSGNILMYSEGHGSDGQQQQQPMTQSPSGNHSQTASTASGLLRRASTLRSRSASMTTSSLGITRTDIMNWIAKTWTGRLEELWIVDQIHFTLSIASVLGAIQFRRKQALYLRYAVRMITPLLHQTRLAHASAAQASGNPLKKPMNMDHGVLGCLTEICNVFGVGENFTSSNNLYMDHGWPELQIDVLYECIRVAEAVPDYKAMMKFSTTLLRQLHAYLTREEQAGLYASLPRILAAARKTGSSDLTETHYWTKILVVDIEVCSPSARKIPFTRSKDTLKSILPESKLTTKSTGEIDPFIYNPFHRKVNNITKLDLVAEETAYFIVTLTNPHGIDLEVQEIRLSTSDIEFEPIPTSTMIPAQTTVSIKVGGVPKHPGELVIRGCWVQIAHCAEHEFFVINPRTGQPTSTDTSSKNGSDNSNKNGTASNSSEPLVRFKKRGLESFTLVKPVNDDVVTEPRFTTVTVIPKQPLLKINSTSLQHGSVMLFEGEKTTVRLTLENIGSIPVDFVTLTFSDSTSQLALGNHYGNTTNNGVELSSEDAYEMELFLKKTNVFSWNREVECHIPVGGTHEIMVDVLGKRGCSSGMIQIDYAYLNREDDEGAEPSTYFVTRQLFSQVLMTVYKTVESLNLDILYLQSHGGMDIPATEPNTPVLDDFSANSHATFSKANRDSALPKLDFSNDGFLAPPSNSNDGDGTKTGLSPQSNDNKQPNGYRNGRRGSRTISKRLSSNFAKIDKGQSVEQLLSKARGDAILPGEQIEAAISRRVALGTKNEYCLLTLDVRNVWTVPVEVAMLVDDSEDGEGLDVNKLIKSTTVIQPGNTQRIILPVRRMALSTEQLSTPIPTLSNKQFVVARGAAALSAEQLAMERALFWFREELLKRVVARWTCKDTSGRYGKFDLRNLRLNKSMLNVLKIEDISFLVAMEPTAAMQRKSVDQGLTKGLEQIGSNRWRCPVDQFAQIRVTVVNRSHIDVKLCLRMQPVQVHGDGTMDYDMGTRMVWHGVLQAPLAKMQPDSTTSHVLPVCFYSRGEFKVLYHAEDVHRRVVYYDHEPLVIEAF